MRRLLLISGDGSPRLPRLEPDELALTVKTVTSVELLRYVHARHPGAFTCGVAFNQYEPVDCEREKLERKTGAGAGFIITQPSISTDPIVSRLRQAGLPVWVGAWMSRRVDRLLECVGRPVESSGEYDPIESLKILDAEYPDFGLYLAQLPFKREWSDILTRGTAGGEHVHASGS